MEDIRARNPYLVLGLPFGAGRNAATSAFARRSREVRAGRLAYSMDDLTWALHQIENLDDDDSALLTWFRVPADPSAFELSGGSSLVPSPEPLARTTTHDPQAYEHMRALAARELIGRLLESYRDQVALPYGLTQPL